MKSSNDKGKWQFSVDRGGTFTDVIGIDSLGNLHTYKLLSESPHYEDSAIEGIQRILGLQRGESIPEEEVTRIRMGTTVATNALLERKGTSVALFITNGFRDLLEIGNQARPELFKLHVRKPAQLYRCVKEVEERIDAEGNVIRCLNMKKAEADLLRIRRMGISSVAIVLMHAWKNPLHEQQMASMARKLGFRQVSVSHEVMPLIKIVGRGQTSVVDAYLTPVLMKYIESVRKFTGNIRLEFMQSSGGITDADAFTGKDAIVSGPAGGIIGTAAVANLNRIDESIGFDMGGTSTDVSRFGGMYEKVFEVETGGIQFQAPSLDINTVAAGGGSVLWFDGQKLRVGPESAGAHPGPVCYGRGGLLALTDANLLLGRILPAYFPGTFGITEDQPLNKTVTSQKFSEFTATINSSLPRKMTEIEAALGFVRIANETMARAIKEISVSRGYDIRNHALVCFGGAAPQHACAIARILGIPRIFIHPLAGLLSAYGIAMADYLRYATRSIVKELDRDLLESLDRQFDEMIQPLRMELLNCGTSMEDISVQRYLDLRPMGTDTFLSIPAVPYDDIHRRFIKAYQKHFGFEPIGVPLELVNIHVDVMGKGNVLRENEIQKERAEEIEPVAKTEVYFSTKPIKTPVFRRDDLCAGIKLDGPAIVVEDFTTIVVEPGFSATLNEFGHILLEQKKAGSEEISVRRDPVMLEVFNHLFMSVAEQMGYTLRNTAHSTNIKERLDFSCAIFDPEGNLVANAPHIPVHLGAMGESVEAIIRENKARMFPGDVYVMNNPHRGGSHLPDITVIAPIFTEDVPNTEGRRPTFYLAARGHHADIGGVTPGSMPPFVQTLEEEGVVIDNFLLVRKGKFREKQLRKLLRSGPFPARNIEERISDLKAQVAAMRTGRREVQHLVNKYGLATVHVYMGYIRENAAEAVRLFLHRFLGKRKQFISTFEDFLDEGAKIAVTFQIEKGDHPPATCRAKVDFSGTSSQLSGNLNAPVAVTKAAVLYVFRTLIDEDIPLNSGCLDPVEIIIPRGSLLNPTPIAAVVGGNVETSQRVVDVLLGALGVAAASQGTMNNFLFGRIDNKGKQYYETIAGGSGAMEGHQGASAVQVHMTNTRGTDPEVLEQRFPELRLERFSIRRGSGGRGKFRGGDGTIREIKFLQERKVTILSERREVPPYGMAGGKAGAKGKNQLVKKDGQVVNLGGKVEKKVGPGETVIIKTPGGGGFGSP